jgi:site-specific recombinase XerD
MTKPISPLRQRMIDDMTMRNLSANTQETYIRSVAQFSAFHRRSPDKLGVKHVRDFHLHLVSRGLVAHSIAVKMAALRFFYGTTLRRPDIAAEIPTPRRPDRLPTVLARAEVERLLKAVSDLKLRTALMTIYSAGLRISEAMRLTPQDIDSDHRSANDLGYNFPSQQSSGDGLPVREVCRRAFLRLSSTRS